MVHVSRRLHRVGQSRAVGVVLYILYQCGLVCGCTFKLHVDRRAAPTRPTSAGVSVALVALAIAALHAPHPVKCDYSVPWIYERLKIDFH